MPTGPRGGRSYKPGANTSGVPTDQLNPAVDLTSAQGPSNEFESFFQSFSGTDYQITAVIPFAQRGRRSVNGTADLEAALQKTESQIAKPGLTFNERIELAKQGQSLKAAIQSTREAAPAQSFYKTFGQLQTLTITSRRSVEPVRRLGETSPAAYTKGPRTFAGSMVFFMSTKTSKSSLLNT